jgi:two-component system, NtrC family, response regulator AtoC
MHILVAEDEKVISNILSSYLTDKGHQVDCVSDGQEALKIVSETSPDVILTDLRMPGMDGMTLLKETKAIDDNIEVIIFSGYGDMDQVIAAHRIGAFGWLKKPIDFRELDLVLQSTERYHQVRLEKDQAHKQIDLMEKNSSLSGDIENIIGSNPAIEQLKKIIRKVAQTDRTTVLISGETGTGKELVARAIHHLSSRANSPLIPVNCTSLTPGIAESELFGHEPGSFTGARGRKAGYFELAQKGTLFLDEIGDMELGLQSQLLRALEQYSFFRVGGKKEISVDVRIIAATNKNLREMTEKGMFRMDLLHRLEVFTIQTPALRNMSSDIEVLTNYFIKNFNQDLKKSIKGPAPEALQALRRYNFPGNVRELRNMIERAMILAGDKMLILDDFPPILQDETQPRQLPGSFSHGVNLIEMEKRMILWALEQEGGVKLRAAKLLGISRESLRRRMEKYKIEN